MHNASKDHGWLNALVNTLLIDVMHELKSVHIVMDFEVAADVKNVSTPGKSEDVWRRGHDAAGAPWLLQPVEGGVRDDLRDSSGCKLR